ncbi:MAG: manganese efflux pump MntP family protein [bacterium]
MTFIETFLIALGLAMDASAVSMAVACGGYADSSRTTFRLAFHFGLFQFMMPVIGWFIGNRFVSFFSTFGTLAACIILVFLGVKMIRSGLGKPMECASRDPSRGWDLIGLSLATSIDALAAGLGLGFLDIDIWQPAVIIGIVTLALSSAACIIGKTLGVLFGTKMEVFGGLVLIISGIKILMGNWV